MRIAQETNLLYTNIRQMMTTLTHSQIVIHNHYAKIIRNPIAIRTTLTAAIVTMITTVNLTMTIRYTAMIRALNDNQCH